MRYNLLLTMIVILLSGAKISFCVGDSNNRIEIIKIDNIGNDFKKYYTGLMKAQDESYNRIWLLNDSFIMTVPNIFAGLCRRFLLNDIVGYFDSYEIRHLIQSYFMILSSKAVKFYIS